MRFLTIGVVLMLAVAGAGCGGGDEAGSDTETTVTETTATDETTTEETTDGVDAGAAGGFTGDCGELIAASAQLSQALGSAGSSDEGLREAVEFYEQLAEQAPDDLRDDFRVFADAYIAYAAVLSDLDVEPGQTPSAEVLARIQEATEALAQPEVQVASTRIGQWTAARCPR